MTVIVRVAVYDVILTITLTVKPGLFYEHRILFSLFFKLGNVCNDRNNHSA